MYYVMYRNKQNTLWTHQAGFEHYFDAAVLADVIAEHEGNKCQVRITKLVDFKCPQTGEWMEGHKEEFNNES